MHSIEDFVNPKWYVLCQSCADDLCRDFNISPSESALSKHLSGTPDLTNKEAVTEWISEYWLRQRYSVLSVDPHLPDELNLALRRELADIDYWALQSLEVM